MLISQNRPEDQTAVKLVSTKMAQPLLISLAVPYVTCIYVGEAMYAVYTLTQRPYDLRTLMLRPEKGKTHSCS